MGRVDAVYNPSVVFADNGVVSSAADISRLAMRGLGVTVPSGWTAADIGFQVSDKATEPAADDATWETLYRVSDDGTTSEPVKIPGIVTSAQARYECPAQLWMAGNARWIRLLSRSTSNFANTVQQTGGPLTLVLHTLE